MGHQAYVEALGAVERVYVDVLRQDASEGKCHHSGVGSAEWERSNVL